MEQRLENDELFKVVKNFNAKEVRKNAFVQHCALLPKLRPYQEEAVQWMLDRELKPVMESTYLDSVDADSGTSSSNDAKLYVRRIPTGGILSDEMGLGKTVEVLACILHNPRLDINLPQVNSRRRISPVDEGEDDDDDERSYQSSKKSVSNQKKERELRARRKAWNRGEQIDTKESSSEDMEVDHAKETDTKKEEQGGGGAEGESSDLFAGGSVVLVKEETSSNPHGDGDIKQYSLDSLDTSEREEKIQIPAQKIKSSKTRKRKSEDIDANLQKGKSPNKKTLTLLQSWYESKLSEVNKNPIRAYYETLTESDNSRDDVQCICSKYEERPLVKCDDCSRWMHKECIGATKWIGSQPIYCPQCWLKQAPVPSRATLIVSPTSITGQWLLEIKKHVSQKENFKVLVYKGVKVDGFMQPYVFADYDIILTTYEILRRELVLAEVPEGRHLRYEKRYFTPTCSLLCTSFWRICLDEAQMVEGTASKAAEMVSRLSSVHRWAVTGTPIQKSMHDLYGLIMFLCVEPYCDHDSWNEILYGPYCDGDKYPLYTLLAQIMWRSSKADVLDQIQIPPQTEQLWWLNFSPVEEHFYLRTHQECSSDFLKRLSKFQNLNVPLKSLKPIGVNRVLAPLLMLRQACSHPQAVRGNVIANLKRTLTMTELLESLIKKTTAEAQEALRKHIASLNGMAGLHIIQGEYLTAAQEYREVLRITQEYNERFKVDSLQRIHTLNNLAEIIENHRSDIPPTLRDYQLRNEASQLEKNYMSKVQLAVTSVEESLVELSESVCLLEEEMPGKEDNNWWVDLCKFLDREEILSRVHDALVNHRKSVPDISSTSIINKVSTISGIQLTVYQWLESLEKTKREVGKSLKSLKAADDEGLVDAAVHCHLRLGNLKSKNPKSFCELCTCERSLKKYEINLFDIKIKKNENIMVGDVYLLGQGTEGSWKPSEQETVLKTILSMGRSRKADKDLLKYGSIFIKLMGALRREFKPLRLLWSRINERTQAQDELNMCKLRLRLRFPDEPTPITKSAHVNKQKRREAKNLSSNIDTKMETFHVIEAHQVYHLAQQNQLESITSLSELRKKSGTVSYLQNLRNKGDDAKSSPELCPICQGPLELKWSVLSCGHCYCMECFPRFFKNKQVQCAICRETTGVSDVSFVSLGCEEEGTSDSEAPSIVIPSVQGSFSTKVEAIVKRIFYLRAADPLVKVLVFSTWDRVLDVLQEALHQNNVRYLRLKSGPKYEVTLKEFKATEEENTITALLLHLKLGSKGLNLTEATHVILIEPLLNPAEELQAIGRVHRIGQTRPTFVHRFLIRETIEDRMFSAVQASGKEQWSGKKVTLQQLKDLFSTQSGEMP